MSGFDLLIAPVNLAGGGDCGSVGDYAGFGIDGDLACGRTGKQQGRNGATTPGSRDIAPAAGVGNWLRPPGLQWPSHGTSHCCYQN